LGLGPVRLVVEVRRIDERAVSVGTLGLYRYEREGEEAANRESMNYHREAKKIRMKMEYCLSYTYFS
jgi:hypothetical protein